MALNDPQWGKRGNDGPPDLDELWRRLNQRLNSLFGGKGGGGAPPPGPSARQFRGGFGLLVILVVVIWLASGFYIVDASQRGVVLRFGGYIEATQPGPRWHLPFPIESVEIVNLSQVRTVEVGYRDNVKNKILKESLMLTDDENIIDIQFAVQYFLKDPADYLFNNRAPDENVRHAAETAIREVVGKNKMDFVLYEGREQVAAVTTKLIQDILDRYKSGILVSKVTMQNAQPPEQVQAAFDDAVKAGQDRVKFRLSRLSVYIVASSLFVILTVLTVALIVFTPIKYYLPGVGYGDAKQVREYRSLKIKTDSMENAMKQQEQFLKGVKKMLTGETVKLDTTALDLPKVENIDE